MVWTVLHSIAATSLRYSAPQMGEVLGIISQHLSALKIKTTIKLSLAYQWYQSALHQLEVNYRDCVRQLQHMDTDTVSLPRKMH